MEFEPLFIFLMFFGGVFALGLLCFLIHATWWGYKGFHGYAIAKKEATDGWSIISYWVLWIIAWSIMLPAHTIMGLIWMQDEESYNEWINPDGG